MWGYNNFISVMVNLTKLLRHDIICINIIIIICIHTPRDHVNVMKQKNFEEQSQGFPPFLHEYYGSGAGSSSFRLNSY